MILYDINYNIYVINNVEINISFYVRRLKKKKLVNFFFFVV